MDKADLPEDPGQSIDRGAEYGGEAQEKEKSQKSVVVARPRKSDDQRSDEGQERQEQIIQKDDDPEVQGGGHAGRRDGEKQLLGRADLILSLEPELPGKVRLE